MVPSELIGTIDRSARSALCASLNAPTYPNNSDPVTGQLTRTAQEVALEWDGPSFPTPQSGLEKFVFAADSRFLLDARHAMPSFHPFSLV